MPGRDRFGVPAVALGIGCFPLLSLVFLLFDGPDAVGRAPDNPFWGLLWEILVVGVVVVGAGVTTAITVVLFLVALFRLRRASEASQTVTTAATLLAVVDVALVVWFVSGGSQALN